LDPPHNTQAAVRNVIRRVQGVTTHARQAPNTIPETFQLFLPDYIIAEIVRHTNQEAQRVAQLDCSVMWTSVDDAEMYAFVALLMYAGVNRSEQENDEDLWEEHHGAPLYRATMTLGRFKTILRFLRFDDKITRAQRRETDKAAPIRDIFETISTQWKKYHIPGENITVDEQLVPYRGKCPFRQYMPAKPG
jgi:hypothetical protein